MNQVKYKWEEFFWASTFKAKDSASFWEEMECYYQY
jgi:hypothetical protein